MSIRAGFSRMAVAVILSAIVPSAADAASQRKNRCCPPAKCQTTAAACAEPCAAVCETALCETTSGAVASPEGSYSAFTDSNGMLYGLNTATGQVYTYTNGDWQELKSIP